MEYEVVYWPRHLWASSSGAATQPTALCRRLSPAAVCVVSVGVNPPAGLELLPAKSSKSRRVVLFDAQVAALGDFQTLHSPQFLRQIGGQFDSSSRSETAAVAASGGAVTCILETVGYYSLYVPFAALLAVATAFQCLVQDIRTPSWLFLGGGKNLTELSTFLAVLAQQLHNAASLPKRLRHFYLLNKQRRLMHQESKFLYSSTFFFSTTTNLRCFSYRTATAASIQLDMCRSAGCGTWPIGAHLRVWARRTRPSSHERVGCLQLQPVWYPTLTPSYLLIRSPNSLVEFLRGNVEWLMGAPAGFKLNKPLASILGNGILLWLSLWRFVFEELLAVGNHFDLGWFMQVYRCMGVTLQLALMADLVNLATWHSHWVFLYFAKLNRLQFGLFSSLSKLFLGKKINVLRHRVDTCEYDVGQLLLGTLLFTVLVFLVTTNFVFFVFFAGVRGSIVLLSLLLWLPVVVLNALPLASLLYRVLNPGFFVVGMQLQTCEDLTDASVTIENVGVGRQSPQLDAQHSRKLRQALASFQSEGRAECKDAVFELVPVASSFSAQLTRFVAFTVWTVCCLLSWVNLIALKT
ncbi:hypothetical protein V7S43_012214 [Phytophthora oleae]|uniref:Phosphatidylinositol N-acetylglucosaminyltransferase subunit Q n=1 Tax=Phytophthora oleae TaxID=2107226 RepID=A0ABD3FA12_9STRA